MKNLYKQNYLFLILIPALLYLNSCKKDRSYNNQFSPVKHDTLHALGLQQTPMANYSAIPSAAAPPPSGTLPASYLLPAPSVPFNQLQLGSCVSCASSMAKSILDHIQSNVAYANGGNIYSPLFIFDQVHLDPNNCSVGSYVSDNLNILVNKGVCKIGDMPYINDCGQLPNSAQINLASSHKIDHYFKIDPISVSWIKQYIFAGIPVIVAFQVDENFEISGKTSIWKQFGSKSYGFHCTILYGWDDSKNAFRMLNSWGSDWGDNGSTWVDYDLIQTGTSPTYGKIFTEAYIIQNPALVNNNPTINMVVNNLPSTTVGTSQTFIVSIRNSGNAPLFISDINIQNATTVFSFSPQKPSLPITIPSMGMYNLNLNFSPTATGQYSSVLSIKSNAASGSSTIDVTGTCVNGNVNNTFTDSRDGQIYHTVQIGNQLWMSNDLAYNANSSYFANGIRLYDFNTATTIAPPGWHLPSDQEWQQLEIYLGMSSSDAAVSGWRGTDQGAKMFIGGSSGLNLNYTGLGVKNSNGSISLYDAGITGSYWTSSILYSNSWDGSNNNRPIARSVSSRLPQVFRVTSDFINNYYAVRCIKN